MGNSLPSMHNDQEEEAQRRQEALLVRDDSEQGAGFKFKCAINELRGRTIIVWQSKLNDNYCIFQLTNCTSAVLFDSCAYLLNPDDSSADDGNSLPSCVFIICLVLFGGSLGTAGTLSICNRLANKSIGMFTDAINTFRGQLNEEDSQPQEGLRAVSN